MKALQTERLTLRGWQLEDLDDLYEYAKNPHVGPLSGWEPHGSKEASLGILQHYLNDGGRWAIVLKEKDKVVGSLKLKTDENRGKYNAKYVSFVLSEDYWGKGYMTEAVQRLISHVFEEMQIDLLSVFHFPHNYRSRRVIEKCGFQYEVTIPRGFQSYDGQVFDTVCYSLLKSDYFAR